MAIVINIPKLVDYLQQGWLTFSIILIMQKHDPIKSFPTSFYWFMVVYHPHSFCLEITLMLIGHRAEEVKKIHKIHSYDPWTFDKLVSILTIILNRVWPISAQYEMHAFVCESRTIPFFRGWLATPAGSESISGLKSSPIYSSKSLIKSR